MTYEDETMAQLSLINYNSELQQQLVEPISYGKPESKDILELKANCFTLQKNVIMFSFAWYAHH